MYRTTNGAQSWTRTHESNAPALISGGGIAALDFVSSTQGWMLGVSSGAMERQAKMLLESTDGGATWQTASADAGYIPNPNPTPKALPEEGGAQLTFQDTRTAWAALAQTMQTPTYVALYKSIDGGATWDAVTVPVPAALVNHYTVPQAPVLGGQSGTLPTNFGGSVPRIVTYATNDAGAT